MKSHYGSPLEGRCESHQCESVYSGQCSKEGSLYRVTSDIHTHVNSIPWEQYSCEEAVNVDLNNGFISTKIDEEGK